MIMKTEGDISFLKIETAQQRKLFNINIRNI